MSVDDCGGLPTTIVGEGRNNYHYYQQLGAPTLIYEGSRRDDLTLRVPSQNQPIDKSKELQEKLKRRNRVRARWQYGLDVGQVESVIVPYSIQREKNDDVAKSKGPEKDYPNVDENEDTSIRSENSVDDNDENKKQVFGTRWMDRKQQQNRFSILLEDDTNMSSHKEHVRNYAAFQHPYVEVELKSIHRKRKGTEPKIDLATYSTGQEFSISHKIDSDPSYLAPFDLEGIVEATNESGKKQRREPPERLPQGNALLCIPCPCDACSKGTQGYIVLHPKGQYMERLCVSNLIPPIDQENAGDIKDMDLGMIRKRTEFHWKTIASNPNDICLDDTILEIRQCGAWNASCQQCIFAIRTGTHISVVEVTCRRPDIKEQKQYTFQTSSCWGCFVLEEKERIDQRSYFSKLPSFRPVSLSSHARYGNAMTPCKFAFASHSVGGFAPSTCNVVHTCAFGTERIAMDRHDITNLKSITLIDFNARNPMCLWSAASSHVRPALAPGAVSKMSRQTKSPFGLGSSLFAIDLRSNSASFQWSPSAEEMTTEGVHSINGILTDWTRDNTVFVTSSSAGKTYEIDGRMPCRAVNIWSLTSICEESLNITLPTKAFYGEPSLLFKPHVQSNNPCIESSIASPLLKVNTDFRASGIHLFQKPLQKPRFQTDSLECIGIAGLDATSTASIATSSYYDLIDSSDDTFTCGISSIWLPLNRFVEQNDNIWDRYLDQNLSVLCCMSMNNKGDIYCHSLLDCNNTATTKGNCRRFDGLPIGTTAINIPIKLDGRTKLLKNGHWKPTGGMNLNLFLSNTYPIPHNAMISHQVVDEGGDKNAHKIFLDDHKKKRIDDGTKVIHIGKRTQKAVLTITGEDSNGHRNEMLREDGEDQTLMMPISLSRDMQRTTMVYGGSDGPDSDSTGSSTGIRSTGVKCDRTDLSKTVIENTLDGWEDTPSESDSLED